MYCRVVFILVILFGGVFANAQNTSDIEQYQKVKLADTIIVAPKSIQKEGFRLLDAQDKQLDTTFYTVDFARAKIYLDTKKITSDSLSIYYLNYPEFLTKKYQLLSEDLIIPKNKGAARLYQLQQSNQTKVTELFNGLNTNGSISRGITIGNNQNSVFNSELDLQLSGKLSDGVTLRASLQDSNIPIQQSGFSQAIDEFDQIFIELEAKNWGIRAGDIEISEQKSIFSAFNKKIQGLTANVTLDKEKSTTNIFASGALVRGIFRQSSIQGQEGNQGPYKLIALNGELSTLIVSGSETVYVNGLPLVRGENRDYIIDYNAGEIRFNPTFPITADMRIQVEYQITQSNFARLLGYGGATYNSKKLELEGFIYAENDLRDQSLQQNLTPEQTQILATAGDNPDNAIAASAFEDTFSEGKTLYRNISTLDNPIYEFVASPTEADTNLFNVRFSPVPQNTGNYILATPSATTQIFEFVAPENGVPQGNFEPIIRLNAPEKINIAVLKGNYNPSSKTKLGFELAGSNNDLNLFSEIDDSDNLGYAIHLDIAQQIWQKNASSWQLLTNSEIDIVDTGYRNIEGLYNVEFNRDWNLDPNFTPENQVFSKSSVTLNHPKIGGFNYGLQYLDFQNQYQGVKHLANVTGAFKNWTWRQNTSWLQSDATLEKGTFFRNATNVIYNNSKVWGGVQILAEANEIENKATQELSPVSQRFQSYEIYTGVGDSTKVFGKIGYKFRQNDSIQNNQLKKIATSNTIYLDSQIIQNTKSQLSFFANFRTLNDVRETDTEKNLNSRLIYRQRFWKNIVQWNTLLETQSGTIAQQEFTFVEVDPGRGQFIWIDFNNNGVQDLQEFEIAPFPDEANFIRVLLPRQQFIRTYQNRFSQQLNLNWSSFKTNESKWLQWLSRFYNQTSYVIDRNVRRVNNELNLNVFENSEQDIGLNLNLRNTLFFNRGKQHFSTTYTYQSTDNRNVLITGNQENNLLSHRIDFTHKFKESWLLNLQLETSANQNQLSEVQNRNFEIQSDAATAEVSYLLNTQTNFSIGTELATKENILGTESLKQQRFFTSFRTSSKQKATFTAMFNWFENDFNGDSFSPVSFQILEGLQPGRNFTWSAIAQKKITKFLELNLNYNGRKAESSRTIHTGSVQLRAFF